VSPLDWAIVETWQKSGIPLAAVLKGIDRAFESYARSRRASAGRPLKSLAYCVDAVIDAAAEAREAAAGAGPSENGTRGAARPATEAFTRDEMRAYLQRNAAKLRAAAVVARGESAARPVNASAGEAVVSRAGAAGGAGADLAVRFEEAAARLDELAPMLDSPAAIDLEDFERRLTVLEDKLLPAMQAGASEDVLLNVRREMDRQLAPYRRKMSAEQLAQLERQYMQKRLFESFGVPRLSLFYLT